jgi:hypothetical protein
MALPPVSSSWRQAPWDSWHSNFTFQLNTGCYSPYVTFSLTRGWVCSVQLLLVLASPDIIRPESRETWHFTAADFEIPPTWRVRFPYLYPLGTGWPGYTPGTLFLFRRLRFSGLRWKYSVGSDRQKTEDVCLSHREGLVSKNISPWKSVLPTRSLAMGLHIAICQHICKGHCSQIHKLLNGSIIPT